MQAQSLEDLFVNTLRDIYYAEKKLVKSLPKMAKNATDRALADGFRNHLSETEGQVQRLERVFEMLEQTPRAKKCDAIEGLVAEAEEIIAEGEKGPVLDSGLIAIGQAVEHYEIARYGALIAWAKQLGHDDAAGLLEETLAQEKKADQSLTEASTKINPQAAARHLKAAE